MTDAERMDWLEAQSAGRGWNVAGKSEGWPLAIVTRGPFATLRQAIDKAMERDGRAKLAQQSSDDLPRTD